MTGSSDTVTVWPAPAKLNLFLHVTGRRADGYHSLQTLFQFLDWGDSLSIAPRHDGVIRLHGSTHGVPPDTDLITRAAQSLQRATGTTFGVDIHLTKRIPLGAGLGGGSSDAATTLMALNHHWRCGLSVDELAKLGVLLGADVPVFVRGQSAWAEGVGELLTACPELPEPWYVVLMPNSAVPTASVFGAPELCRNHSPVSWADYVAGRCVNDCWPVVATRYPDIVCAHEWLSQRLSARLTGTGAALFAVAENYDQAAKIASQVPKPWQAWAVRGCNDSPFHRQLRLQCTP